MPLQPLALSRAAAETRQCSRAYPSTKNLSPVLQRLGALFFHHVRLAPSERMRFVIQHYACANCLCCLLCQITFWLATKAMRRARLCAFPTKEIKPKQVGRGTTISFSRRCVDGCTYSPVIPPSTVLLLSSSHPSGMQHFAMPSSALALSFDRYVAALSKPSAF